MGSSPTRSSNYNINYVKYNSDDIINKLNKSKYKNAKEYFLNRKKEYELSQIENIKKIRDSNIDFSKMGWVKEVSKIVGISENKGSVWMKRNMKDFYENKCWKRKLPNK